MIRILLILILLPFLLTATNWHVDNTASGGNDGTSWTDSWESFADISWASLSASDTLFISGGTDSTIYNESLDIQESGSSGSPIIVIIGQSSPHNGKVVITGSGGLSITNEIYVTVSGRIGSGSTQNIKVRDATGDNVTMNSTTGVIVEYIEVCWSGDDGISVDEQVGGGNIIRNCDIHDLADYGIIINRPSGDESAGIINDEHLIIENNEIHNLGEDGIHAAAYAGGLTIRGNEIHTQMDNVAQYADGMQLRGWVHITVESNWIHDLWSVDGVNGYIFVECDVAQQSDTDAHDIYIFNNLISETDHTTNSTQNSKGIEFKPIACGSLRDVLIANNTIVDTRVWGIEMHEFNNLTTANVSNVVVINNIIYNNDQRSGGASDRLSFVLHELNATLTTGSIGDNVDIIWDHNLVDALTGTATCRYGGPGTGVLMDYSAFNAASGCDDNGVEADPTFTNYSENGVTAATDLRLSGSDNTALNAGVTSDLFSVDYADVVRPQDAVWDIGAYEYVSGTGMPRNLRIIPGGSGYLLPDGSGKIY